MTTLLVTLVLVPDRSDEVLARLRSEVAPWLRRLPGFVTSRWLLSPEHDRCTLVVELAGTEAVPVIEAALRPGTRDRARSWWCERMEDVEDLGLAVRPSVTP
ncbi:hypothetical protein GUY44_28140 [Pimelobacter simplex]|uniref:Uncharacterized protein n=1 Tax=Nocardioides simplex TaxID=2045 RepID=A0A0A1DP17_NOCSI|nr:hypothetical protein [Pimelobacter simplex]AIY18372.1 hypothetical protein KR76_19280 [Pimelobacter simplex]KAB2811646.1 hypothetical protein F9L07_07220 [Pimelobacter simplex]MCG8154374.1 hypothetical protein [Pimelobacter simplex]SFM36225.1 hypothetical protein SAMN05421671_1488 [Pimelobacter simplex]GEB16376.1 hypothetical protein NSI01_46910 [Pimelobacter simplex]